MSPVLHHLRIGRYQFDAFGYSLRHQNPVKWILVNGGQSIKDYDVIAMDWYFPIPIVEQAPAKYAGIRFEILPPQSALDGHFPQAGRAEKKLVVRIAYEIPGFFR